MTTLRRSISVVAALCVLGLPVICGQRGPGKGTPRYDASTETTIKGTVEDVPAADVGRLGLHLMVKTEAETMDVRLGPASFVSGKGFTFAKGDAVEITGSKVSMDGKDAVIAREVVKDGKTLTLRDKMGRPMWSGGRR